MMEGFVHREVYSVSAEAFKAEQIFLIAIKCKNTCYIQELGSLSLSVYTLATYQIKKDQMILGLLELHTEHALS